MPNHVTTTLTITGPATEILRFQRNCIRVPQDDCPEKGECLDFQALVPEPPESQHFLDMASPYVIHQSDGTHAWDWYTWRMHHWSTKWNSYAFSEEVDDESYECTFDTASTYPDKIIFSLAKLYPMLEGSVHSDDPNHDWTLVGEFSEGRYQRVSSYM